MNNVENRVVRMQFDNGQFESEAKTTLGTLFRIKEALNFSGASSSLDSALNSVANMNLSGLEDGIETTSNKFSLLAQAAAVALGNIASQAISAGAQMVKAFAIEPITQGFEEYELKMNSIQTMMMSTGEPLERVNQKLGELNDYADKTIYSFSDMTSNIGKFTNAGVSLDKSVAAIQGVANVAALSGANATDASHAMYNFGQALSSGSVRLQDWKSIEVANMATVEFKNELIKTALAMGTLVQEGDKYVSTTTDLNGNVSDAFNTTQMFNDSLSSQWLTTEVLTETLNRYADETTEIGKKAFKAATQVKTFSQLIDTTKEAIGTGWADSFEIVIGNFEEARDLWTSVSDIIGDFVGKQAKARNELLQSWKDLGGRSDAIKALANVFSNLGQIMGAIGRAWEKAFPPMTGSRLAEITKSIRNFTERLKISESTVKAIETVFSSFFGILSIGVKAIGLLVKPVALLAEGFLKLLGVVFKMGSPISSLIDFVTNAILSFEHLKQAGTILERVFESLMSPLKTFGKLLSPLFKEGAKAVDKFVESVEKGFSKVYNAVKNFDLSKAVEPIKSLGKGIASVFAGLGLMAAKALSEVGHTIAEQRWFQDAIAKLETYKSNFESGLKGIVEALNNKRMEIAEAIKNLVKGSSDLSFEDVGRIFDKFKENLSDRISRVKEVFSSFVEWISSLDFSGLKSAFEKVKEVFSNVVEFIDEHTRELRSELKDFFEDLTGIDAVKWKEVLGLGSGSFSLSATFETISEAIQNGGKNIGKAIQTAFEFIRDIIKSVFSGIAEGFSFLKKNLPKSFGKLGDSLAKTIQMVGDRISQGLGFLMEMFSLFEENLLTIVKAIENIVTNRDFGKNLESSGIFAISLGVKNILDSFGKAAKDFGKVVKPFTDTLKAVQNTLKAYQSSLKAGTLLKIAAAIGVLSASLLVLANIPADNLLQAGIAIAAMAVVLSAATKALSKFSEDVGALKMVAIGVELMGLSASILIVAQALKQLSALNPDEMFQGMAAVTMLLLELTGVAMIFSKLKTEAITKSVFSIVAFSHALKTIAGVAADLATLDPGQIYLALGSILALEAGLELFAMIAGSTNLGPGKGLAIMEVALALLELTGIIKILTNMNFEEEIVPGLISIGVLLAELGAFAKLLSGSTGILTGAAGMVVMGAALLELCGVIAILGNMQVEVVAQGLTMLGYALLGLVVSLRLMNGTATAAAAMLLVAAALTVLTPIILTLGATWPVAAAGILVMAAALGVMGVAGMLMSPLAPIFLALSVAMLSLSASVVIAGAGLVLISAGLTALAGAIVALAAVAEPAIESVISVFKALAEGILNTIVDLAPLLKDAVVTIIEVIAGAIVETADVIVQAIVSLARTLIDAVMVLADPLIEAVVTILELVIQKLADHAEAITVAAIELVVAFINGIRQKLGDVVNAAVELIIAFIDAMAEAIRTYTAPLTDAIINLVSAVAEGILSFLEEVFKTVPVFGDKIANGLASVREKIRDNLHPDTMRKMGEDAGNALGEGLHTAETTTTQTAQQMGSSALQAIKDGVTGTFDIGAMAGKDFGEGLGSLADFANQNGINVTTSSLTGLLSNQGEYGSTGTNYGEMFSNMLGAQSGNAESAGTEVTESALEGILSNSSEYEPAGENDGSNFVSGLSSKEGEAQSAGVEVATAGANGMHSMSGSFEAAGSNAGAGFAAGLRSWVSSVADTARSMAAAARDAISGLLNEHSPSRVTMQQGEYAGEGFAIGMTNSIPKVEDSAEKMASSSLITVTEAIAESMKHLDDMSYEPEITPVLDLSTVSREASGIQSILENQDFGLSARFNASGLNFQNGSRFAELAKSMSSDNTEVVDQLKDLRTDLGKLAGAITSMKVVLDSGILVGATSALMDNALQTRQIYAERGV